MHIYVYTDVHIAFTIFPPIHFSIYAAYNHISNHALIFPFVVRTDEIVPEQMHWPHVIAHFNRCALFNDTFESPPCIYDPKHLEYEISDQALGFFPVGVTRR